MAGGYGRVPFKRKGKTKSVVAHRISWQAANGKIPDGMIICHKCDTPSCVNPGHLFIGTDADNVADMLRKGRARPPRGEANGNSKLTAAKVLCIRTRASSGEAHWRIAADYGVSRALVSCVVRRDIWAWLP
jgi:HNH endonuclease